MPTGTCKAKDRVSGHLVAWSMQRHGMQGNVALTCVANRAQVAQGAQELRLMHGDPDAIGREEQCSGSSSGADLSMAAESA